MPNATMKMTQPSASWKNPSAASGFTWVSIPVMVTRLLFATMAIGTVERNSTTRIHVFFSKKYPYTSDRKVSESSDRIPLHASTTESRWLGSSSILPSRKTGMESNVSALSANRLARSCSGNVIWL